MSKHLLVTASLAASLATLLGGCFWATTKSEGDTMRADIKSLDGRLATKEQALDTQIAELKKVIDDATKILKRNSADLGADVDQMRNDLRTANGLATAVNTSVNELKTAYEIQRKETNGRLDGLEQRLAQLESGKPSAQSSAEDLWKLGTTAFEAGRFNDAIEIYKRLTQTFPTHERADDAQYFRGQAYTNMKQWDEAIAAYQRLFEKYPDSSLADDGLYFAALAAQTLKNCTEARTYLGLIKQKYPKSNVLKQADDLDKQLKKDAKAKDKCSA
jgi:TolA-binding protein